MRQGIFREDLYDENPLFAAPSLPPSTFSTLNTGPYFLGFSKNIIRSRSVWPMHRSRKKRIQSQKIVLISEEDRKTDPSLAARTQGILFRGEGNRGQPLCSLHGHTPGKGRLHNTQHQEVSLLTIDQKFWSVLPKGHSVTIRSFA